jgi:hypothetical protein
MSDECGMMMDLSFCSPGFEHLRACYENGGKLIRRRQTRVFHSVKSGCLLITHAEASSRIFS